MTKNKLKNFIGLIILFSSISGVFSQNSEDIKSFYLLNWYNSNLAFLDAEKIKFINDSLYLKSIHLVQTRITSTSYRRIDGKSERELIIDELRGGAINIDLDNCFIIEEYTSFHSLKYNVTIITNVGDKVKLRIEGHKAVILSIDKVDTYDKFIKEFTSLESIVVCDSDRIDKYQLVITEVTNGQFMSKILAYPCSLNKIDFK